MGNTSSRAVVPAVAYQSIEVNLCNSSLTSVFLVFSSIIFVFVLWPSLSASVFVGCWWLLLLLLLTCIALYRFVLLLLILSSDYSHTLFFTGITLFTFPHYNSLSQYNFERA